MTNEYSNDVVKSAVQAAPHGVHLVGSVPLKNAEEVFRNASSILGGRLQRLPDGETGVRSNWIGWQYEFLAKSPHLEVVSPNPDDYAPLPRLRLRHPVSSDEIHFDGLGYADAAKSSYALFSRMKQDGSIPAHYRFQVSLPTPLAPIIQFIVPEDQAVVEPAYEKALLRELDEIVAAIPAQELAIQWDIAVEFGLMEGVAFPHFGVSKEEMIAQFIRLGNRVPVSVELGYHLCYGDAGHRHFIEPKDTTLLTEIANAISAGVTREIQWMHMPVPRNRSDEAYFAPLRNLHLHPETKLYLGLVHNSDGVEGARERIAAAQQVVSDFGVATECGMGRRSEETIPDLLHLHSSVAAPA